MARRQGSAVRCDSAGVRLWAPLASSQRAAHAARHQMRIERRGGEEGRRGVSAAVCATLPRAPPQHPSCARKPAHHASCH
eukprot:871882-Rhodomonas_salina.1